MMEETPSKQWACQICGEPESETFYRSYVQRDRIGLGDKYQPTSLEFESREFCGRPACLEKITAERNEIRQKVNQALGIIWPD